MAIQFDGSSGTHILCGSEASIDDIFVGGGAVCGWVKIDTTVANDNQQIFGKGVLGVDGTHIYVVTTALEVRLWNEMTNDGNWASPDNSITTGVWKHVAVTYNATTVAPNFFIDGTSQTVTTIFAPTGINVSDAGSTIEFGSLTDAVAANVSTWLLEGSLEDWRMYDSILTNAQIATLAAGYRDALGGEVAWFTFEDADGVTVWDGVSVSTGSAIIPDKSVNSNTGTPQGTGMTYRASAAPRMAGYIHE